MFSSELFSFQGRASRSKFWLVFLLSIFVSFVVVLFSILAIPALIFMGTFSPTVAAIVSILLYVIMIPMWWISIATSVKRFHDRNKSGWWYLIVLVPFLGELWLIIENGFLSGTAGANNYGNDPLLPGVLGSSTTATPQFTGATSLATPTSTGPSAGMLIVYIVGGIFLIALLGRLGWAFWEVQKDAEKVAKIEASPLATRATTTPTVLSDKQNVASSSQITDAVIEKVSMINLKEISPTMKCEVDAGMKLLSPLSQKILKCEVEKMNDTQKSFFYDMYLIAQESARKTSESEKKIFLKEKFTLLIEKYKNNTKDILGMEKYFEAGYLQEYVFVKGKQVTNSCALTEEETKKLMEMGNENMKKIESSCSTKKLADNKAKAIKIFQAQVKSEKTFSEICRTNAVDFKMCQFKSMNVYDQEKILSFYNDNPLRDAGTTSMSVSCAGNDPFCKGGISGSVSGEADVINMLFLEASGKCGELLQKLADNKCTAN